jgi:thioredoxin 1
MKAKAFLLPLLFACGLTQADTAASVRAALTSGQPALVEFGASTCTNCKRMKVVLDGMTRRYQGRAHIVQVNINQDMDVAQQYRVMVIPTLVFFDARGREVERRYGFQDEVSVAKKLFELGAK